MSDKTKHLVPGDIIWAARGITNYTEEPYCNWTILYNSYKYGDVTCTIKLTNGDITDTVTISSEWEVCWVEHKEPNV